MDRNTLREVILEQKEIILNEPYIRRECELEPNINYCFVGMRRSGKSFLMYHQIHEFLNSGGEENHFTYVNFEDERLLEMTTEDLNLILEIAHELAGPGIKPLLFLDEIHNVAGWDHFARRLADMKYRVSITGSNSKNQVCKVLHKDDATFKRETEALIKLAGFLPGTECLILTDSEEEKLTVNDVNISVLPIWKWLLKENS